MLQGLSQMEFGVRKVAAGAPEALLAALEMALEMELGREPGTALLSLWALSFQSWPSFAGADPLT